MDKKERARLKQKGWESGTVEELLGLSDADVKLIDLRRALGKMLKARRKSKGVTQQALASALRSSQPRVAVMEAGADVSLDRLVKSLMILETPGKVISKVFAKL